MSLRCHASPNHADATPRGPFGDLCDVCWNRMVPFLTKILGRRPVWKWFKPWPYGPPDFHQASCVLHVGYTYCDCAASDASDTEWGEGFYVPNRS